ncbi:MAG: HAMP domain-containing protein [Nitrospirae bacterium]|nr:HAMP domain-containing protein [Nitrospirota bacterium]MBI3803132.1 HAMP domain-containing protein [Candidatus Manganitrophaceae bacterium]
MSMLVSTAALLLASLGFIVYELITYRDTMVQNFSTQAEIIGINTVSALVFNDPQAATETIAALRVKPNIMSAAIYTADGKLFAKYVRNDGATVFQMPEQISEQREDYRFESDHLLLSRPIISEGKQIGMVHIQSDLKEIDVRLKRYALITMGVLAISLLAAYRISSKLQEIISHPLLHLAQTAKTVSEEKNYSVRAVAENQDEIGQLVLTFNEMLTQIQMRDDTLSRAHNELEQRVTERTLELKEEITERQRAQEEMRKLNTQLEAANKELEAFSYSVSHDLRAPLRHINGFVELLKMHEGTRLGEKSQHYMNTIMNSAKRMGDLVDDLLVFSRMGKSEMRVGKVDLDHLTEEVIKDLQPEIGAREITWKIASLPEVEGDVTMLRQVCVNLIGNAIKYTRTRAQAQIEIGYTPEKEEHVFFIRDNGVGFDPQFAGKLFGVFQRLHRSDEFEGTGIGLANVRRIVHRHGGRTWAEGRVDGGAVFSFSLPKRGEKPE